MGAAIPTLGAADTRNAGRGEKALDGELIAKGGARLHHCAIRDISPEGARVDTGYFVKVPRNLLLLAGSSGHLFECEVRWQQGREIDLRFVDVGSRSSRLALARLTQAR